MADLVFRDWESALERLDAALGDATLGPELTRLEPESPLAWSWAGASLVATGEVTLSVLNAATDPDPDGVFGAAPDAEPVENARATPQLPFQEGQAWLKIGAEVRARGAFAGDAGPLGWDVDAEGAASIASYTRHSADMRLATAFPRAVGAFGTVFSVDDILALPVGAAVSLGARGSIGGTLTLAWSDVFTSRLTRLASLLDRNELLAVDVSAGAFARFSTRLRDTFRLTFSRPRRGTIRVALARAHDRARSGSAWIGATARLADPAAVDRLLQSSLDALVGRPAARIDEWLARADLDEDQRTVLIRLADRLGLGDAAAALETVDELRARWETLKADTRALLTEIAETKARVGLEYEFARLDEGRSLLQATLPDARVAGLHGELLSGETASIADETPEGVRIERFLRERSSRMQRAWGFSLGIGRAQVGQRDVSELTRHQRDRVGGLRSVTYDGLRGYASAWMSKEITCHVDWSATMPEFATTATADRFRLGWHLTFSTVERGVSRAEIEQWVDQAIVWGAVPEGERGAQIAALRELLKNRRNVELSTQLVLGDVAVRAVLAALGRGGERAAARALAAALPWLPDLPSRATVAERVRLHESTWRGFIGTPSMRPASLASLARRQLRDAGYPADAFFERMGTGATETLEATARRHPRLRRKLDGFLTGARDLADAIGSSRGEEEIPRAHRKMQPFFAQAFYVRTLGALLWQTVESGSPAVRDDVQRVFRITHGTAAERKVLNVTAS